MNLNPKLQNKMRVQMLLLVVVVCIQLIPNVSLAAEKLDFEIENGRAARTLKAAAVQGGAQILYTLEIVRGVRTHAVHGRFSLQEVLDQMLADTPLVAVLDSEASSYIIMREDRGEEEELLLDQATDSENLQNQEMKIFLDRFRHLNKIVYPVLSIAAASTVFAQDEEPAEVFELETFTVNSIYSTNLSQSLEVKRQNNQIMDVVVSDEIGKLPAQNVAEALQRVPGVSIERDRGEGITVRVRGLGGGFQVTTLNGQTMSVNENVRTSGQTGRQFRYDTLPAELVSSLEVIKSPNASMDEGAIGGIVNVNTFRPLDIGESRSRLTLENSYAEFAGDNDLRLSGLYNWVDAESTFGFLVSAAFAERSLRQDRLAETGWNYYAGGIDLDGDGTDDASDVYVPSGIRPTLEMESRERLALTSAIQWRPSDKLDLGLEIIFSEQEVNYDEYSLGGFNWRLGDLSNFEISGNAVHSFDSVNSGVQISRETSCVTDLNTSARFTADWVGDVWEINSSLFLSNSHSWDSDPIRRTRLRSTSGIDQYVSFPKLDGSAVPTWAFTSGYNPLDPNSTPGRRLEWREIDADDNEAAAQIDISRELSSDFLKDFQYGFKVRERSREYYRRDIRLTQGIEGEFFDASYFMELPARDFLSGTDGDIVTDWLAPIESQFWGDWPQADLLAAGLTSGDLRNSYEVSETILSGYLMSDIMSKVGSSWLRGNVGVRISNTEQETSGHASVDGQTNPVQFKKSYTNVLPSANLVYEINDNTLLRGSFARVITRPSITDLSSRLTFNSSGDILTASGGNPDLEPFEAWQYDVAYEWYPSKTTAFTAGLFYKDIDTFIQTQLSDFEWDGQTYLLSSKVNGSNASVLGAEIAFSKKLENLPAPFDGLGYQFNYTWTDSEATYVDGDLSVTDYLEGVAKNTYNFIGFYEKGRFAARLSYSWSDTILNSVGTANRATRNRDSFGSLDGSLSYRLNDGINLFMNAINITEETQRYFVGDDLFSGYTNYGSTYTFGVNWSM